MGERRARARRSRRRDRAQRRRSTIWSRATATPSCPSRSTSPTAPPTSPPSRRRTTSSALDVVVNNAGYGQFGMIEELSEEELRDQLETNVFGALWVTQAALPLLRAAGQRPHHPGLLDRRRSPRSPTSAPTTRRSGRSRASRRLSPRRCEFGINVTLVEPGGFATDWAGDSARHSEPIAAYDAGRERRAQQRAAVSGQPGDPNASAAALLRIVVAPRAAAARVLRRRRVRHRPPRLRGAPRELGEVGRRRQARAGLNALARRRGRPAPAPHPRAPPQGIRNRRRRAGGRSGRRPRPASACRARRPSPQDAAAGRRWPPSADRCRTPRRPRRWRSLARSRTVGSAVLEARPGQRPGGCEQAGAEHSDRHDGHAGATGRLEHGLDGVVGEQAEAVGEHDTSTVPSSMSSRARGCCWFRCRRRSTRPSAFRRAREARPSRAAPGQAWSGSCTSRTSMCSMPSRSRLSSSERSTPDGVKSHCLRGRPARETRRRRTRAGVRRARSGDRPSTRPRTRRAAAAEGLTRRRSARPSP